jgi:hypothetical protein
MICGGYPVWADYSYEDLAFGNRPFEDANEIGSGWNIVNVDKDFFFAKAADQAIRYAPNYIGTLLTSIRNENK